MNVNNYQLNRLEVVVVGRCRTFCDIQTSFETKTPRRRRKMLA